MRHSPITLGHPIRRTEAGGFVFTETRHSAELTLPLHSHEQANLSIVLHGSFQEILENEIYDCRPRSLVLKPPGQIHSNRYGHQGAHCLIIEIAQDRFQTIQPFCSVLDHAHHVHDTFSSFFGMQLYQEFLIADAASRLALEALTLELLALSTRAAKSHCEPRWLLEAKDRIDEQFQESLTLSQIAEPSGIHPAYLARSFRKYYGCTVGEYVRRRRLDFAANQLVYSDLSLLDVATESGFYDQSHFTHAFKLRFGMTPSEFRRSRKARTKQ